MSYSISLSGHGAPPEEVKRVFERAVRKLREVTPDVLPFAAVSGSFYAGGSNTESYLSGTSDDVPVFEHPVAQKRVPILEALTPTLERPDRVVVTLDGMEVEVVDDATA